MKKYLIILFMGLFFMQCSKKTTDGMVDKGTEIVKDAAADLAWRSNAPSPGEARAIELGEANSFDLSNLRVSLTRTTFPCRPRFQAFNLQIKNVELVVKELIRDEA